MGSFVMSMARSIIPLQSDVAWSNTLTGPMVLTYLPFCFFFSGNFLLVVLRSKTYILSLY